MDTVKGNEVIAEFRGLKSKKISFLGDEDITVWFWPEEPEDWFGLPEYDQKWDSLIPALRLAKKKIEEAGWGTPLEKEAKAKLRMALNETANLNIENAHYCLVKFIEWYTSITTKV
jgi:hypothetical protein